MDVLALLLALLGLPGAEPPIPPPADPPSMAPPAESASLPDYRSVPTKPAATRVGVPVTGAGFITLGSLGLGIGTAGAVTVIVKVATSDPSGGEMIAGMSVASFGAGASMVGIGLAIRKAYRKSPVGLIPNAPRTGAGQQLGGLAVLLVGVPISITGLIDRNTAICRGDVCGPYRPKGAAIQIGVGLAAVVVGTVLVTTGSLDRRRYRRWATDRVAPQIRPSVVVDPIGFRVGLSGRF